MRSITREESRAIDARALEELGLPGLVLMESAGRGAADALLAILRGGGSPGAEEARGAHDVRILTGRGGNGGDGFVLARHLFIAGVSPSVTSLVPLATVRGDAATMLRAACGSGVEVQEALAPGAVRQRLATAGPGTFVVDAVLGVGFRPPLAPDLSAALAAAREAHLRGARIIALDLPSGLDANTGEHDAGGIVADVTLTFVAPKAGFVAGGPQGEVQVVSIGTPSAWTRG